MNKVNKKNQKKSSSHELCAAHITEMNMENWVEAVNKYNSKEKM